MKSIFSRVLGVVISLAALVSAPLSVQAQSEQQLPVKFKLPMADSLTSQAPAGEVSPETAGACWSLPMEGKMNGDASTADGDSIVFEAKKPKRLDASIDLSDGESPVAARIDEMMDKALERDAKAQVLDQAVTHYRTKTQRAIAQTKDTVDYVIPFRGFGPSSEAGDVILGEQVKLKSRASAEYARQKHIDELNLKLVSNLMHVSMGLGTADPVKADEIVSSGVGNLKELVGDEEAMKTMQLLNTWTSELSIPPGVYAQGAWTVAEKQAKLQLILENALSDDPVLHEVEKRIHKYNQKSKFSRASSKVIQSTLATAALTPSFVGPAAKAALVAYVMATGGPEQCKLLKELYLDKRLESRWRVLNEKAHLALENYQVGILTKNPALMACSEAIVSEMVGKDTVEKVFGESILPRTSIAKSDTKVQL